MCFVAGVGPAVMKRTVVSFWRCSIFAGVSDLAAITGHAAVNGCSPSKASVHGHHHLSIQSRKCELAGLSVWSPLFLNAFCLQMHIMIVDDDERTRVRLGHSLRSLCLCVAGAMIRPPSCAGSRKANTL